MNRSPKPDKPGRTSATSRARSTSRAKGKSRNTTRPPRGRYSIDRRLAVLVCGEDRLHVDLNHPEPLLRLEVGGRDVLAGPWRGELTGPDGQQLPLHGDWEHACWESDADGDYLEVQLMTDHGVRIDRMLFVERRHQFALLADAVVSDEPTPSPFDSYSASLALADHIIGQSGTAPLEVVLAGRPIKVRTFPLGLQSDRTRPPGGNLKASAGQLHWSRQFTGGATWAPLLLDWNPKRTRKPATWCPVTVSEDRKIVPAHVAKAARWQCGTEHLLCYRSLQTPQSGRAALGLHTWSETVVTRLKAPGKFHTLLQIVDDPNQAPST